MKQLNNKPAILGLTLLLSSVLSGCATFEEEADAATSEATSSVQTAARQAAAGPQACQSGDQQVSSQSQCLQDDSACYQLANGQWCTGSRAARCPKGSEPVSSQACPEGAKCFNYSESLRCMMKFN